MTIRNMPDEVLDELSARAAASGQSLQEYVRTTLIDLAAKPDPAVLMQRVRERLARTGTRMDAETILRHVKADRR